VTDLDLADVGHLFRGREDGENRSKELKYDFAADSFCLNEIWVTEATLNSVMMAYSSRLLSGDNM